MSQVSTIWFTSYAACELAWSAPILESLGAYWCYINDTVTALTKTLHKKAFPQLDAHLDPVVQLALIARHGRWLDLIPVAQRTPEMCAAAVRKNGHAIRHVPNQTLDLWLTAVRTHGLSLEYIQSPFNTYEVYREAVMSDGRALKYVPYEIQKAHRDLCLIGVQQDGLALKYVHEKRRTEEVCMAAVTQNPEALAHVKGIISERIHLIVAVGHITAAARWVRNANTKQVLQGLAASCSEALQLLPQ